LFDESWMLSGFLVIAAQSMMPLTRVKSMRRLVREDVMRTQTLQQEQSMQLLNKAQLLG
jgi:hypothetical protein